MREKTQEKTKEPEMRADWPKAEAGDCSMGEAGTLLSNGLEKEEQEQEQVQKQEGAAAAKEGGTTGAEAEEEGTPNG